MHASLTLWFSGWWHMHCEDGWA